ncbi:MAG: hypothetical protein ACRYG2_19850 [Janthinobacterium lividum]
MPARQGKPTQQPKDAYAQTGKALASQVQRLRGWISTDASRVPELVDALNALVAHRLDGHAYAAAGADAQEAVRRSADLLLASGPIGPYSSAVDAGRCGTALVQLAALQVAVGLVGAAGATLDSWDGIRTQVAEAGTTVELAPEVGRQALSVAARVSLADGDVASANAYADAVLAVGGPPSDDPGFGAVDLGRLASDVRWAAGLTEQSLGFLHTAKESYERVAGDRLAEPGRLAPALAERLTEPLPGLYRDLADRLAAVGEVDLALANRRQLVARLHAFESRSETFRAPLATALTDLASDLLRAERAEEAFDAATEAQEAASTRGVPAATRLLAAAVLARASLASGRPAPVGSLRGLLTGEGETAGPGVRSVVQAALAETLRAEGLEEAAASAQAQATAATGAVLEDQARGVVSRGDGGVSWSPLDPQRAYGAPLSAPGGRAPVPTWLEQERAEARRQETERAEEARRDAEERAAEEVRTRQAALARAAARAASEAQEHEREEARRQAADEAEQAETKRRREERLRQHQAEVDAREREERAVRSAEIDARLAELDAAEEAERDRLLAQRALLDGATTSPRPATFAEPVEAPEPATFAEPVEAPEPATFAEPAEAPEPATFAEPVEAPEPATFPELVEGLSAEPGPEPEPPPGPDPLHLAEQELGETRAGGGRREVRAALEAVVDVLRGRHAEDPTAYAARLRAALEELSSLRLRGGDIFGARAASREARTLR